MKKAAHLAARLVRASQKAYARKWSFLAAYFLVLAASVAVLASFDVLPDLPKPKPVVAADTPVAQTASSTLGTVEQPTKIEIPAIGLAQPVSDPTSLDVAVLDAALLKGPVRYPSSSNLGETGNVIIFGHSSYLPVVHNQEFKAFDGIQKLKTDDTILVYGSDRVYVYAVDSVKTADATADSIPLDVAGSRLTLATCDSFGTKSSRFIVTAHLVGSNPVGA